MAQYMAELGWGLYSFDHEGGDGQYEFNFNYADALTMADRMVMFRLMAKHCARQLGCIATFMPKPFQDDFGSAAHINISLADPRWSQRVRRQGRAGLQRRLPALHRRRPGPR